jgi:DNA-binding transcriptional LysR family regulator
MNLRQLEAFRAAMITGSMTEAGRMLSVSQPSVSRLISDLEINLGLRLFERRNGRIHPTPEAKTLYEEVERSFVGLERIAETVREIRNFRRGRLSIAAMPALCLDLVPDTLAAFLKRHASASFLVQARSSQRIINWIGAQRYDIGLAGPPFDLQGVRGEFLVSAPCVCVLPVGHRLASRPVVAATDLDGERLIALTQDLMLRHHIARVLTAAEVRVDAHIETPLSFVACRMVEKGLGVAVIEPFTARHYLGRNLVVKPFRPVVVFSFGVLTPQSAPRSHVAAEFLDVLKDQLQALKLPGDAALSVTPLSA